MTGKVNTVGMSGPMVRGKPTLTAEEKRLRTCERTQVQRTIKREWLSEYRMSAGCMDCGYNEHPAALDFDHRPGEIKLFPIMRDGTSRNWDLIKAEIAKCDVVCANCHRIRTAERLR